MDQTMSVAHTDLEWEAINQRVSEYTDKGSGKQYEVKDQLFK